ncbi:hypothetical protein ACSBR1_003060 [Camellia fascicularis]
MENGVHGSDALREDDFQLKNLNADKSPFQRTFVNQVKRCAEMSRKLRFFKYQIQKAGLMSSAHPAMLEDVELEELEIQLAA